MRFDPANNASNIASRGLSFELVELMEWATRKAYGERRFQLLGYIGERLHAMVFTPREGQVHVIMPAQGQFERGQEICQNAQIQN
jgi:uncharacterized DUF497 family protein